MTTTKYNFDLSHSNVGFHVRHLMISKVHGRFRQWSGSLEIDDTDVTKSRVAVEIETGTIDTQEEKRDEHLRSADFFEVERFPTMTFESRKVEAVDEQTLKVTGDLTIRGVTKSVVLEVESLGSLKDSYWGSRIGFSAKTNISRKEFGLTWNKVLETGGIAVSDKVEITLEIEAIQAAAAVAA